MQRPLRTLFYAWPLFAVFPAQASTSVVLSLEAVVDRATSVALVEPQESTSRWEDGKIVTYTHVRVAENVAGAPLAPLGDTWIRTLGGSVGDIGQIVAGEADMRVRSLVFLRKEGEAFVVVGRAQGQYLAPSEDGSLVLRAPRSAGRLLAPNRANGAPGPTAFVLAGRSYVDATRTIRTLWEARHAAR